MWVCNTLLSSLDWSVRGREEMVLLVNGGKKKKKKHNHRPAINTTTVRLQQSLSYIVFVRLVIDTRSTTFGL